YEIYDANNLSLVATYVNGWSIENAPVFSADGKWMAVPGLSENSKPYWMPTWVPQRLQEFLFPSESPVRIVRLADGKTTRLLPGGTSPTTAPDGLWTVTRTDHNDDRATRAVERWSFKPPGPPWWLWGLTACLGIFLVHDHRKSACQ